jgi:hypothetical protein
LASLLIALFGFIQLRKKREKLRNYLEEIEDIYTENESNPKKCEKELISLREEIKGAVTEGKLEEGHFLILDKKIDDHLRDLKARDKGEEKEEVSKESPEDEEISEEGEDEEEGKQNEDQDKDVGDEEEDAEDKEEGEGKEI